MINTMQQTNPAEVCTLISCTQQHQATLNAAPASTKQVNGPIEVIIPFHRVATIVVIASIIAKLLVLLSLIGWLSFRRQEPFVRICCIHSHSRDIYGSSPRAAEGRDTSTVKKSGNDVENVLTLPTPHANGTPCRTMEFLHAKGGEKLHYNLRLTVLTGSSRHMYGTQYDI